MTLIIKSSKLHILFLDYHFFFLLIKHLLNVCFVATSNDAVSTNDIPSRPLMIQLQNYIIKGQYSRPLMTREKTAK